MTKNKACLFAYLLSGIGKCPHFFHYLVVPFYCSKELHNLADNYINYPIKNYIPYILQKRLCYLLITCLFCNHRSFNQILDTFNNTNYSSTEYFFLGAEKTHLIIKIFQQLKVSIRYII